MSPAISSTKAACCSSGTACERVICFSNGSFSYSWRPSFRAPGIFRWVVELNCGFEDDAPAPPPPAPEVRATSGAPPDAGWRVPVLADCDIAMGCVEVVGEDWRQRILSVTAFLVAASSSGGGAEV